MTTIVRRWLSGGAPGAWALVLALHGCASGATPAADDPGQHAEVATRREQERAAREQAEREQAERERAEREESERVEREVQARAGQARLQQASRPPRPRPEARKALRDDSAPADYRAARALLDAWDPDGGSTEANRAAWQKALRAFTDVHARHRTEREAARLRVSAAYTVARMHAWVGDRQAAAWWKSTTEAYRAYRADKGDAVKGSLEAWMAAEADFTLQDAALRKSFDHESGHHRYKGTIADVIAAYHADGQAAGTYHEQLERLASLDRARNDYLSPEFTVAALARQGSLYDSMRTGLEGTHEPELQLFTPQQDRLLRQLEASGQPPLMDRAMELRASTARLWQQKRDEELRGADQAMIVKYALAVALGRNDEASRPVVARTWQRLAFFTGQLGDARMAEYTAPLARVEALAFTYEPGMFLKPAPGSEP